jgi:hypothetical protein
MILRFGGCGVSVDDDIMEKSQGQEIFALNALTVARRKRSIYA